MTPRRAPPTAAPPPARRRRRAAPAGAGQVVDLVQARIVRALDQRQRYTYVQPRVLPVDNLPMDDLPVDELPAAGRAGAGRPGDRAPTRGWCIVSPNCSRSVDPAGGEIRIAWFQPDPQRPGHWQLHAFDHALQRWCSPARGLTLADALAQVVQDPDRRYWP